MPAKIKTPCRKRTSKTCRNAKRSCVYISSKDGKRYCKSRRGTRKRPFRAKRPNADAIRLAMIFDNSPNAEITHTFQPSARPELFDKPYYINEPIR